MASTDISQGQKVEPHIIEIIPTAILRLSGTRLHKDSFQNAIDIWAALHDVVAENICHIPTHFRDSLLDAALASACLLSVTLPNSLTTALSKHLAVAPFVEACMAARVCLLLQAHAINDVPLGDGAAPDGYESAEPARLSDSVPTAADTAAAPFDTTTLLARSPLLRARQAVQGTPQHRTAEWLRRRVSDARAHFLALCLLVRPFFVYVFALR